MYCRQIKAKFHLIKVGRRGLQPMSFFCSQFVTDLVADWLDLSRHVKTDLTGHRLFQQKVVDPKKFVDLSTDLSKMHNKIDNISNVHSKCEMALISV